MLRGATVDRTGLYRYHLWREWDRSFPTVAFVMLNPSTADDQRDDPTVRRCIGFARSWGYGRLEVVNLFAYRATSPRDLLTAGDPVGPRNEAWLRRAVGSDAVIVAWGDHGASAPLDLRGPVTRKPTRCLGLTAHGQPRHPLYVAASTVPSPFTATAAP
jgi:hypothetical protein